MAMMCLHSDCAVPTKQCNNVAVTQYTLCMLYMYDVHTHM